MVDLSIVMFLRLPEGYNLDLSLMGSHWFLWIIMVINDGSLILII